MPTAPAVKSETAAAPSTRSRCRFFLNYLNYELFRPISSWFTTRSRCRSPVDDVIFISDSDQSDLDDAQCSAANSNVNTVEAQDATGGRTSTSPEQPPIRSEDRSGKRWNSVVRDQQLCKVEKDDFCRTSFEKEHCYVGSEVEHVGITDAGAAAKNVPIIECKLEVKLLTSNITPGVLPRAEKTDVKSNDVRDDAERNVDVSDDVERNVKEKRPFVVLGKTKPSSSKSHLNVSLRHKTNGGKFAEHGVAQKQRHGGAAGPSVSISRTATRKALAPTVVSHLQPYYTDGKFASRALFKDLAKSFTHILQDRKVRKDTGELAAVVQRESFAYYNFCAHAFCVRKA